jgi:SSS family solute:Na+ symporter
LGFASIMDYVQALFSFFIAPLFGTVVIGMLWKRITPSGGFYGLLAGTLSSIAMFFLVKFDPDMLSVIALSTHAKALAEDMYRALWSCLIGLIVTVGVSMATKPKPDAELVNLVYGVTNIPKEDAVPLVERHAFWAVVAIGIFLVLQWIFW